METPVTAPTSQPDPPDPTDPAPPAPPSPPSFGDWFASLYRSSTERLLGGVAGGLAERFGLPVLLVRVMFVAAAFVALGVPLYVLAWVFLPTERGDRVIGRGPVRDLLAVGAVVVAAWFLLAEYRGIGYGWVLGRAFPWLVILGGIALVLRRGDRPAGPHRAAPSAPPAPGRTVVSTSEVPPPPPGYEYRATGAPGPGAPRVVPTPKPPRPPRPKPVVGPLTWCLALLALGAIGLVEFVNGTDTTHFGPGPMAAVLLMIFGAGLTFSAFRGRARGLLLPALALAVGLGGLAALDVRADSTAGPFDLRITSESRLPSTVESAGGSNTFDVSALGELSTDHTVRIRQTAGELRVILPRSIGSRVVVDVGTGSASLERPSARMILWDPDVARRWADDGLPKDGATLTATELRRVRSQGWGTTSTELPRNDGVVEAGDQQAGPRLRIYVDLGLGNLRIIDPRWSDVPAAVTDPTQLCTVGGGPRGVVKPCDDVPADVRVALCLNDTGNAVDCREDRPGTADWPRVALCRGFEDDFRPCIDLDIEPIGAELISSPEAGSPDETIALPEATEPDQTDPLEPTDGIDPLDPETATRNEADPSETALPSGTVPAPSPGATVPPVPTTVSGG